MLFDGWGELGRVVIAGFVTYLVLVAILRVTGKRTLAKLCRTGDRRIPQRDHVVERGFTFRLAGRDWCRTATQPRPSGRRIGDLTDVR